MSPPRSAAGNDAGGQRHAVFGDLAGAREPDAVLPLVLDNMPDRLFQRPQPERLTDDESVQRQAEDERLALRLPQHFLELVDDHVGELASRMVAPDQRAGIVELERIRHREQRSGPRLHPDRLVVDRPVEQVRVARLLEQVGRDIRLERGGPHPSGGPDADMLLDHLGDFLDDAGFVLLPHPAQDLGVGAAMAAHVVAALPDLLDDVGILVADRAVEKDRRRELELVEHLEQAPVADAVAVIAPCPVARRLRPAAAVRGRVHADAGAEGEMLDVERHVHGKPLAAGPAVIGPLRYGRIAVAAVRGKFQHQFLRLLNSTAPARRRHARRADRILTRKAARKMHAKRDDNKPRRMASAGYQSLTCTAKPEYVFETTPHCDARAQMWRQPMVGNDSVTGMRGSFGLRVFAAALSLPLAAACATAAAAETRNVKIMMDWII